jgi:hypothetical protein
MWRFSMFMYFNTLFGVTFRLYRLLWTNLKAWYFLWGFLDFLVFLSHSTRTFSYNLCYYYSVFSLSFLLFDIFCSFISIMDNRFFFIVGLCALWHALPYFSRLYQFLLYYFFYFFRISS